MQPEDVRILRDTADELVGRLGLAGYDNASIRHVDAWVDGPEFREEWAQGSVASAYDVGAYLGEAIIRRHGGRWSFAPQGPVVQVQRNGLHVIDPFGKVRKRVVDGASDELLALVDTVEHVTRGLDASAVKGAAFSALTASSDPAREPGVGGLRLLAYLFTALIAVPVAVFVAVVILVRDPTYAFIGALGGVPLGLVVLALLLRGRRPKSPAFAPGTRAFEAQLTLPPLRQRLLEKLDRLGPRPSQHALAEVDFYTRQLLDLESIVARRDTSPGRGYVGFDTYAQ